MPSHPFHSSTSTIYPSIFFYLFISKQFDLVYGRFLHGCYIATFLKNKVIFETHEIIFDKINHRNFIFKKLIKNKNFKKLIVISQALKNIYLEKKYLRDIKIQVAHDGADEIKNFDTKVKLMGYQNKLKVGYVGHLYKGRGIETIIECAKKINDMSAKIVKQICDLIGNRFNRRFPDFDRGWECSYKKEEGFIFKRELRGVIDQGKKEIKSGIIVSISIFEDKVGVAVGVTKDLTLKHDAVNLVKIASKILGGKGGGGRKDFAQAGGVNRSKIDDVFKEISKKTN